MIKANLDHYAAQYAQQIVANGQKAGQPKEIENLITKTLGVLQEQGVYACILFLFSRTGKEKEIAPHLRRPLHDLLTVLPDFDKADRPGDKAKETLAFYSNQVCEDLDILLLVKELYEQTLIYARYGAKAAGNEEDNT
jgi:hypothetical protein